MRRVYPDKRFSPIAAVVVAPLPATAHTQQAPLADHHQHLFSPALSALIPAPLPAAPTGPLDAAQLVEMLDAAGRRRAFLIG